MAERGGRGGGGTRRHAGEAGGGRTGGRAVRLAAAIKVEVADALVREVKDPAVQAAGLLTVTHVAVTDDLRTARIMVSLGVSSQAARAAAMKGLARAGGYLRGEVARRLGLRHAPELRFELDDTAERAARIDALLREDGGAAGGGEGGEGGGQGPGDD